MVGKKVLADDCIIECPLCGESNGIVTWNDTSYVECKNREMRKLYTPLTSFKAFSSNKRSYYKCPNCGEWVSGEGLHVYDCEMNKIEGVGWKQVCRVAEK